MRWWKRGDFQIMQKDNIDADAAISGGRRRFLLSAAALGSWFVAGGCASIRGERTTVPSSPPANERPTGSREGIHLFTWSWHRHFDNEPNLSPMVWLSQDPKHKDVNSPLKFARRASQVAERHGRVAVHVWHPSKAWLKLAPPFGADIEGCWRKLEPYLDALEQAGVNPELWVFDYEQAGGFGFWKGGHIRSKPELLRLTIDALRDRYGLDIDMDSLMQAKAHPKRRGDYEAYYTGIRRVIAEHMRVGFGTPIRQRFGRFEAVNWEFSEDSDDIGNNNWPIGSAQLTEGINCPVLYFGSGNREEHFLPEGMSREESVLDRMRRAATPDDPQTEIVPWVRADRPEHADDLAAILADVNCTRALLWNPLRFAVANPEEHYRGTLEYARVLRKVGARR